MLFQEVLQRRKSQIMCSNPLRRVWLKGWSFETVKAFPAEPRSFDSHRKDTTL
jgi:hypothetical protein